MSAITPDYARSVIHTFTVPGDVTNIYAMIDAAIVAEVKAGLTDAQKAVIDSRVFVPTPLQANGDPNAVPPVRPVIPRWGGGDPAAVYFKATNAQMQAALAKYYR